jgi:hypothetical protein
MYNYERAHIYIFIFFISTINFWHFLFFFFITCYLFRFDLYIEYVLFILSSPKKCIIMKEGIYIFITYIEHVLFFLLSPKILR